MIRNIFVILTVIGLGIILPINMSGVHIGQTSSTKFKRQENNAALDGITYTKITGFIKMTPQFSTGPRFWGYTVCAYLFDIVICGFIWYNYRAVLKLRRAYLQSPDYLSSLHSRTLMITHIPPALRTDEGLVRITEEAKPTEDIPRTAIARNVKDLPDLIAEHSKLVLELESYLAKYLKDPNNLPAKRPTCKPSKSDKGRDGSREVDAIEYLTERIRELERQVKEVRETIDKRSPNPYGFCSYTYIEDAHSVAYKARKSAPQGTSIRLASKPNDIIWRNLATGRKARKSKSVWNGVWMTLLTIAFIPVNVLVAVFLSDFSNLGGVWPAFNKNLKNHKTVWGIIQGIVAPLVQVTFYLILPTIFRRLFNNAGDTTKTSRERHVTSRLFAFYLFNQLIVFSLFAAIWRFIAATVAHSKRQGVADDTWRYIVQYKVFSKIVAGLCNTSPFFITFQLQKLLGASVDLMQLYPLIQKSFLKRFSNPTPRQLIELSAPQTFQYADYYNNFLFTAAVGLAYSTLNPVILPITAFYLGVDAWLKKYMLQYVVITRVESGGLFWRMAINRLLVGTVLCNLVIALVIGAQGVQSYSGATKAQGAMLYAMVPLPFLLWGFKVYCRRVFDDKIGYNTTQSLSDLEGSAAAAAASKNNIKQGKKDRVGVRFGDPALYKRLMKPMVNAKAQYLLKDIYRGRTSLDEGPMHGPAGHGAYGYSDIYMSQMSHDKPGKSGHDISGFELVDESDMDFEHFKKRAEFREEFGGDGELYSRPQSRSDALTDSRPGSVASMATLMGQMAHTRKTSDSPTSSRASSRTRYDPATADPMGGHTYAKGYHTTAVRGESPGRAVRGVEVPDARLGSIDITSTDPRGRHPAFRNESDGTGLMDHAAAMGRTNVPRRVPVGGYRDDDGHYRSGSSSRNVTPGQMTPRGMSAMGDYMDDETSYDYFRRGRQ